jgi:hypothetical protein
MVDLPDNGVQMRKRQPSSTVSSERRPAQTPFRPKGIQWQRGPAWIEGDNVLVDRERATFYAPLYQPVWKELTGIRSAADVPAFVEQYGLLRLHPTSTDQRGSQPVAEIVKAAEQLREVIRTVKAVRAVQARDTSTAERAAYLDELRQRFTPSHDDDRSLLIYASGWAAWALTVKLMPAPPRVYDPASDGGAVEPGRLRIGIIAETLEQVCYMQVAIVLSEQEPIDVCRNCGRPFVPVDGRSKYCGSLCAGRFRQAKYAASQAKAKRSKAHGKTTRTR